MPSKCAVGNILYSWNYAYNDATIGDKKPSTLKDFFNKKFPGKRAIYKGAMSNIEIAITADGVANNARTTTSSSADHCG
jgi:putative spermidine/putrescine transport system substrate-binding protein